MSVVLDRPRADARGAWWLWVVPALALGLAALVFHDYRLAWFAEGEDKRVIVKLALYWFSWLLWLALMALARLAFVAARQGRVVSSGGALLALVLCSGLAWARFIEPKGLSVHETALGSTCGVRVALISDLHVGLFVRQPELEHLVDRLNALDVDAVLVAGDWTFEPSHDLRATFAPMARVRHPVLAVLGNHDEQQPGPDLKAPLLEALAAAKVKSIDGQRVSLGRCELEGLGDLRARSALRHLAAFESQPSPVAADHRVVLAHNPDTVFELEPGHAFLMLSGHTHGGQIDLPYLTERLLARGTVGGFRQGLYAMENARVFVTSGVGIDKLPWRFRVPPVIDVLSF